MAGATLTVLQGMVEEMTKRTDITSEVVISINDAILDLTMMLRPHEMEALVTGTTTAGTDTYALAADTLTIEQVVITNPTGATATKPVALGHSSPREWMLRGRDSDSRGIPGLWLRRNNSIELFGSIPDTNGGSQYSYEIAVIKRPALLVITSPSTAMDLNSEWNEAIAYSAAAKLSRKIRDWEAMQIFSQSFMELLGVRETPRAGEARADEDAGTVYL